MVLTRQEREYLAEKRKLTAALLMRERPYAYAEGGAAKGVIPEVVRQVARDLGVEIDILPAESPSEAARLLRLGQADFVADAICDFSWAEGMGMAPTQSYLQLDYVMVHRKGIPPGDNPRVACCETLLHTKNYIDPKYPADRRVYADSIEECFRLVNEGKTTSDEVLRVIYEDI